MPHTLPRKTHTHTHRFLYHVHEVSVGKYLMRLHCVWTGRLKAISVDVCRQRRPSSASSELIKVQYTIRKHCASLCRLFTHTTNDTHTHTHNFTIQKADIQESRKTKTKTESAPMFAVFVSRCRWTFNTFNNRTELLLCPLR